VLASYSQDFFRPVSVFSALTLLDVWQKGHTAWWGAGMIICLQCGADLHMVQMMPVP